MNFIFLRIVAWSLLLGIVVMTVVPSSLRVDTETPGGVEHAVTFFTTGVAFGSAYRLGTIRLCVAGVVLCALIELLQLAVPDRHARLNDFFIDAVSACIGIAIPWIARRLTEANRVRKWKSGPVKYP